MSRKRRRNQHSKKRDGRPKNVAHARRSSSKRKRYQLKKKQLRKQKKVEHFCTICQGTSRGRRTTLDCGHVFHKECAKRWLNEHALTCPVCRRQVPRDPARCHQPDPETRNNRQIVLTRFSNTYFISFDGQSSNVDNSNMDADAQSPDVDNLNSTTRRHQPNLETREDHFENSPRVTPDRNRNISFTVSNNQSPNVDNSNMDLDAEFSNMDNLSFTSRRHQPNLETGDGQSQNYPLVTPTQSRNIASSNQSPNVDDSNMDTGVQSINVHNLILVHAQSPIADNLNMYEEVLSYFVVNVIRNASGLSIVDSLNMDENAQTLYSECSSETRSSQVDMSEFYPDGHSPTIDSSDPSPNLENSRANSQNPSPNLNIPATELPDPSRVLDNSSVELPVLFIPVLLCSHQNDSNVHSQQESLEANGNVRTRSLWNDRELHGHMEMLRNFLEHRYVTFNVLNSPAELDRFGTE